MQNIGIDSISFYTSPYYIDLAELAQARNVDPERFKSAIGQDKMAVPAPDEDIITLAANAAQQALQGIDRQSIDTVFFATESGIDQSKAAGMYIQELLELPNHVRVVELKQACYSATAALRFAIPYLQAYPDKKVLIIASDIARYGLATPGESSQGCGAVAMVLSANPRLVVLEPESGVYSESTMDFWRPNYRDEALVDGIASSKLYLNCLQETWSRYVKQSNRQYKDHAYFCFHVPVAKLVEKAFKHLLKVAGHGQDFNEDLLAQQVGPSLVYNRIIGNCYAGALYLSLCSLLDNTKMDITGKRIGFYSYGSGCVAEYFSGVVQANYTQAIQRQQHQQQLNQRKQLTIAEYEEFYHYLLPEDGSEHMLETFQPSRYRLAGIKQHKRIYTSS